MQKSQLDNVPQLPKSSATFSAEIMDSFPEYGLTAERILRNGTPTNTQLIIKNGNVIHHFTEAYKVLPNEEAFKVAEQIKKEHGLIFAKDMPKDWKGVLTIPEYMGSMDRGITTLLIDPKQINLTAGTKEPDDFFKFGIGIGNSIDGSSSLKTYGFTFRQICGNFAFHKFHIGNLQVDLAINPGEFNDAKILNKAVFIHSKNIDIDIFAESVKEILKAGKLIVKRYQAMKIEKLLDKQAQELVNRLPHSVLKDEVKVPWLKYEKKKGYQFVGDGISKYQAFNDLTDSLTHSEDLSYHVQMKGFKSLDRILVAPSAI